jgi:N utilization substance protein A
MNRELLLPSTRAREKMCRRTRVHGVESRSPRRPKSAFNQDIDARVEIDRETGDYESFRRWTVARRP